MVQARASRSIPVFARYRVRLRLAGMALGLLALAGCRGGAWTADEQQRFFTICGGGASDPLCQCLARELPKAMPFKTYAAIASASQAMASERLDDEALKKMAHAAVVCARR